MYMRYLKVVIYNIQVCLTHKYIIYYRLCFDTKCQRKKSNILITEFLSIGIYYASSGKPKVEEKTYK